MLRTSSLFFRFPSSLTSSFSESTLHAEGGIHVAFLHSSKMINELGTILL